MVNKVRTSSFGSNTISPDKIAFKSDIPTISSVVYIGDDTATDSAGGQTVTINGTNFVSGCYVYIDGSIVPVVTFVSSVRLTFTAPAKSAGAYSLFVYNPDGGTAYYIPGISYSGTPTWSTASGSIGASYETVELSSNVTVLSASSDSTIRYRLYSGTLPTNAVLNTDTGAITGISGSVSGITTYSFSIEAYDLENQGVIRSFSITINPDAVTWSSPANGTTLTSYEYGSISQVLSASSSIGRSVSYAANTLPTGITLSGNTISGIPTVTGTNNSLITATAATSNKTATRNINFQINPDVVTWSSPADGTTITSYEYGSISQALSATSVTGRSISYSANTLPTGLSISGNTISGTPTVTGTNNSLITATSNTTNRSSNRNINFQINPDVVTWSSPADSTLINSNVGSSITQSLSASSATGRSITYTANTLPAGLSISSNTITGTLTAQANTTSLITATSATTNRTATRTLLFYVKTVPNAPTIGTATVTGSTTATVAFTAPVYDGNSPITQYIATSSPGNITATGSSSPINMTGLTTGTSYTFTVKAVNAAGQSVASSSSNSITTYSISGAPTIGSATATSSTTASISFTAPASNGGTAITSYTAVSSPGNITGTLSQAGSGTINVSGLTPGTTYSFTVYATNSVGNSSSSSSSNSVTPITVPNAPTIGSATATGQTTATVSFSAPGFNGGATITSYTAVSSPGGVTGTLSQSGSGTISISGLSASTSYTFTVYATNSVGNSSPSSSSNQITTQAAIPPSVEFMVVAGGGSGGGGFDRGGGGGGAGGMITGTQPISQGTPYSISIGGGAGASPNFGPSSSGSPSTFASYTGNGGGGGGTSFQNSTPAQSGGCGGGGGQNGNMGGAPGNQGYPGGNGRDGGGPGPWVGGGGGGMGSAGTSPGGNPAGPGGTGLAPGISGPEIYYSGGGGAGGQNAPGGSGGNGGGGPGGSISSGNPGSSYTGGGGGGGAGDGGPGNPGGAGGSGVVVIAYPTAYPGITNISPGLAYDVPGGRPGYRVYRFYGGSGPISW